MQNTKQISTDEIRGRECADYIREFCAEQRALAAEYGKSDFSEEGSGSRGTDLLTKPS